MSERNGGLAFPSNPPGYEPAPGMTLRDWFAGQALPGMISAAMQSSARETPWTMVAAVSYAIADAMLAARETTP